MSSTAEIIGIKLASALLLQHGELSLEDIQAIPFLTQPSEAETIIKSLLGTFDAEIYQKKVTSYPTPQWEQVIRLRGMQYERRSSPSLHGARKPRLAPDPANRGSNSEVADMGYLLIGGVWRTWDTRYLTDEAEDFPYQCDMINQYYSFTIHSPVIFLPLVMK